jgi:hypothetical protein
MVIGRRGRDFLRIVTRASENSRRRGKLLEAASPLLRAKRLRGLDRTDITKTCFIKVMANHTKKPKDDLTKSNPASRPNVEAKPAQASSPAVAAKANPSLNPAVAAKPNQPTKPDVAVKAMPPPAPTLTGSPTQPPKADLVFKTAAAPKPGVAAKAVPTPKPAHAVQTNPAPKPVTPKPNRVSLELIRPGAKAVAVAGSFNEWKPERAPLTQVGDGKWVGNLTVKPGRHEYLFVVDGQWLPDPNAKESVQNPYGGRNSVLIVSE